MHYNTPIIITHKYIIYNKYIYIYIYIYLEYYVIVTLPISVILRNTYTIMNNMFNSYLREERSKENGESLSIVEVISSRLIQF